MHNRLKQIKGFELKRRAVAKPQGIVTLLYYQCFLEPYGFTLRRHFCMC